MKPDQIIKNVRIYNDMGLLYKRGSLFFKKNQVVAYSPQAFVKTRYSKHNLKDITVIDGMNFAYFFGGMLDAHHHGHDFGKQCFGWDTVTSKKNHFKQATIALGKTGLSYVMATLPSLDPGWCDFRTCDENVFEEMVQLKRKGKQSWLTILPGCAKASYLLSADKFYYIDKISDTIKHIVLNDKKLIELKYLLKQNNLMIKNNETKKLDADHPAARLSIPFLRRIQQITGHRHRNGHLKTALTRLNKHILSQSIKTVRGATKIVGVHLEGPFIAVNYKGAHDEKILQSHINFKMFLDIIQAAPAVKQWKLTLAPELSGAIDFLIELKKNSKHLAKQSISVKINIGHSNADKTKIKKAIQVGATGFTHLGNACGEECHRDGCNPRRPKSNITQYVLANSNTLPPHGIEIIADGKHLSTAFISHITNILGDKLLLVTDALGPVFHGNGVYRFGTLDIIKKNNAFYLAHHPNKLAGSAATLAHCAENFISAYPIQLLDKKFDAFHRSAIFNPRKSSLDEKTIKALSKESARNGVLVDSNGKVIFSLVHGKVITPLTLAH